MAIFFSSGQFIQITRQDQHTCESTKIYTFVIPNHSQMYDQHDTDLAAPILREAFKNDPIFGDLGVSAGERLMLYNVEARGGEEEEEEEDRTTDKASTRVLTSTPALPSTPTRSPTPVREPTTAQPTSTAKTVQAYPTTASLQEIVSGPMDRIRGPNVIRLAKSYGNSTMAELINAAHPGETNINGNNIGERLHAAYAAAGDDGDELKREVNDARVGLGVKVRGRDKDTATAEGSRRSGRNG
ncbi:hypothetical protein BST61_g9967 [Cercospora zeina]